MPYSLAADALLIVHLAFICFVVLGGLLVLRWRWLALLHLPSAVWGALIEFQGWICPLTPLEQRWRAAAGQAGYTGSFIEHYLVPVLYPDGLDRHTQLLFGALVVVINAAVYAWLLWRRRRD